MSGRNKNTNPFGIKYEYNNGVVYFERGRKAIKALAYESFIIRFLALSLIVMSFFRVFLMNDYVGLIYTLLGLFLYWIGSSYMNITKDIIKSENKKGNNLTMKDVMLRRLKK